MLEERNVAQRSNPAVQQLEGLSVDLTLPGELFAKLCRVPGAADAKTKKGKKGKKK